MRIKVPLLSLDPEKKLSHDDFIVAKALGIVPEIGKNFIILELNDEQLENLSPSVKKSLQELLKVFLARFGSCLWTATLISLGGQAREATLALEETLGELRRRLLSIVNQELGKQIFDF